MWNKHWRRKCKGKERFNKFVKNILVESGVKKELHANKKDIWVKGLYEKEKLNFMVIRNMDSEVSSVCLNLKGKGKGLFSDMEIKSCENISLSKGFCDLFVVE